ncbi:MAG TPA: glycoside hydrolase family 3 N-terminal domain-containing protein [Steroidobacteraceae bacterium]|nr:glycoside hydrolase family 3 N-terminal domain-containing protein [Steroidobacteraceae bacterium]
MPGFARHIAVACVSVAAFSGASLALAQSGAQVGPRAETLLKKMTLEEKIGQLVQRAGGRSKALNSRLDATELDRVRAGQVGSYLHVAGAEPLGRLQKVAVEESRLGVPLLFAMDVVHGYRTIFPVPLALAATWAPEAEERAARVAAEEATAAGLHWTFAPMIDIARDPRWGRIVEGAGEDPYLGARMAVAAVNGFQGGNTLRPGSLMATAKHFGAYGAAIGGRDYNTADLSERTLNEVYLPPFYAAARAGSGSFMVAFNDIAGVPTTANRELVRGTLRERWGWQGLMVSDWGSIGELPNHGVAATRAEAGLLALDASVDMDMVGGVYADDLQIAIAKDPARLKLLDEAVLRILRVKEQLGLFDDPMRYTDVEREKSSLLSAEHREAARAVARQSLVLLKNDGKLLPLKLEDGGKPRTLAVIGALANDGLSALGSWRAQGKAEDVVTILQGIQGAAPKNLKVTYAAGADPRKPADDSGYDAAVKTAKAADVIVLVIGEDFDLSGEARSRSDLELPANQLELARRVLAAVAPPDKAAASKPAKPVIVVLANGRPLAMQWLHDRVPAILESWMPGVEGGPAVADALFGRYSPAGRLPASFPRVTGAVPGYYSANPTGRPADPDLAKDTVRYHDLPITPLYAFGHGLSYTEFKYGDLAQSTASVPPGERVDIAITVENIGGVASDEVVQLYVRDPVASVSRPVLELRGFKRIELAPGARKRVTFSLSPEQLAFWNKGSWVIEAGRIDFWLGASSADLRASGSFEITRSQTGNAPATALPTRVIVSNLN